MSASSSAEASWADVTNPRSWPSAINACSSSMSMTATAASTAPTPVPCATTSTLELNSDPQDPCDFPRRDAIRLDPPYRSNYPKPPILQPFGPATGCFQLSGLDPSLP